MAPFEFPPSCLHAWRALAEADRTRWLERAHDRVFSTGERVRAEPGRTVVLDGRLVDSVCGFYCAIGEAVNGPGGYFGRNLQGFDDCLFGGFGLEFPYTIVWRHAEHSRRVLDGAALLDVLGTLEEVEPDARHWVQETRDAALAGTRTLFDLLVDAIQTVPERGGQATVRIESLGSPTR